MRFSLKSIAVAALFAAPSMVSANASKEEASFKGLAGFERAFNSGYKFDKRDGWMTIDVSANESLEARDVTTEMAKRDVVPEKTSSFRLEKRHSKKQRRSKHKRGHHKKRRGGGSGVEITWYSGSDLNNPYCFQQGGFQPHDANLIAAVTEHGWGGAPKCGQFLQLCHGHGHCVTVRVIDMCAGCAAGSAHVDLSKGAFSRLAPLSAGIVNGIQMRLVAQPHKWNSAVTRTYGPQHFT